MRNKFGISIVSTIAMALLIVGVVAGMTMGNLDGVWETIDTDGATCDAWATSTNGVITAWSTTDPSVQTGPTTDENQVRYGIPADMGKCPDKESKFILSSGFGFNGVGNLGIITIDEPILLGKMVHYNRPINYTNPMEWVKLDVTIGSILCGDGVEPVVGGSRTYVYRVTLDETPNSYPCAHGATNGPCNDKISISTLSSTSQPIDCTKPEVPAAERGTYSLKVLGWIPDINQDGDCSDTPYNAANVSTGFITGENMNTYACLYGVVSDFVPTAVTLFYFTYENVNETIVLKWETITETNTLGFNILRSSTPYGDKLQMNSELIYSMPGNIMGSQYQFTDFHVVEGMKYYYWLQEVELDGTTIIYGNAEPVN